jgi:agmatinase
MIGGDDSVPIPFLAGLEDRAPVTVLQIDAHIDWPEERRGERFGYSSTMKRVSEMAHVARIVQVGMSNFGSARTQEVDEARNWGAHIVTAREVHHDGVERVVELIPRGRPLRSHWTATRWMRALCRPSWRRRPAA